MVSLYLIFISYYIDYLVFRLAIKLTRGSVYNLSASSFALKRIQNPLL
jgi:hypothetical protein